MAKGGGKLKLTLGDMIGRVESDSAERPIVIFESRAKSVREADVWDRL